MERPLTARAADEDQRRVFQQRRLEWCNSTYQLRQEQAHHLIETPVGNSSSLTLMSHYSFTGLALKVMDNDPEYTIEWKDAGRGTRFEFFKDVDKATERVAQYCGVSPHLVECLEAMSRNGHANRRELHDLLLAAPYHAYER